MMMELVLAGGLLVTAGDPGAQPVQEAESGVAVESVEGVVVKVDPEMLDAELTRSWVIDRVRATLDGMKTPLEEGAHIRIVVRGEPFDYRVSAVLFQDDNALASEEQPEAVTCACGSDEMLDLVATMLEDGASTIAVSAKRKREHEARVRAQEQIEREKAERLRREAAQVEQPRGYQPSPLGRNGVVVVGVGVLAGLAGGAIAWQEQDDFVPGVAIMGVGLTMVVGGVTMVVIDAVRCRRDRSRCGGASALRPGPSRWAWRLGGGA